MKHLNITIQGRVQGVFFRATAKDVAESMGITGFAENRNDGSVCIEAEGEADQLSAFLEWCHKGSTRAVVSAVDYREGKLIGYTDFQIRR